MIGETFTVEDLNVASVLSWARIGGVALSAFPNMEPMAGRMHEEGSCGKGTELHITMPDDGNGGILRCWSQESNRRHPTSAEVNTIMATNVGKSNTMTTTDAEIVVREVFDFQTH